MKSVMGLLDLQRDEMMLQDLTKGRTIASLPFAGRYRIVDFPLSSMVNSGIRNVGVLLAEKSRSVLDHLRSGKDWGLARHHKGLVYLPPVRPEHEERGGDLRNLYYNLDFVENNNEEYVLLARAASVYNMNFQPVLRFHQNTGADVTMVMGRARHDDVCNGIVVEMAANGLVMDLAVKPNIKKGELRSLGVYVMEKKVFLELVRRSFEHGGLDFRRDVVARLMDSYTVYAYEHKGFAGRICSMLAYYEMNLAMVAPAVWEEMFLQNGAPVYTKVKDMPPVRYKEGAVVKDSLVANGCEIYGEVTNSVLFRGVKVAPGAVIRNSVVMQEGVIQEGANLDCVVCDKSVRVTPGKELRGAPTYPLYIGKQAVI